MGLRVTQVWHCRLSICHLRVVVVAIVVVVLIVVVAVVVVVVAIILIIAVTLVVIILVGSSERVSSLSLVIQTGRFDRLS